MTKKIMKGDNMKWTHKIKMKFWHEIRARRAEGRKGMDLFTHISERSETLFTRHFTPTQIQKTAYNFKLLGSNPPSEDIPTPSSVKTQCLSEVVFDYASFSSSTEMLQMKRIVEAAGRPFMMR